MHEELSKYEKYLKSLTPENGVALDVLSNEFKFNSDEKNIVFVSIVLIKH